MLYAAMEGEHTGQGDMSALAGKPVYLRFEVKNMGLCGFEMHA